MRVGMHGIEN